jgi:hypothetical protein
MVKEVKVRNFIKKAANVLHRPVTMIDQKTEEKHRPSESITGLLKEAEDELFTWDVIDD